MITQTCSHCGASFEFADSQAGLSFRCTQCGQTFDIAGSAAMSQPAPAPSSASHITPSSESGRQLYETPPPERSVPEYAPVSVVAETPSPGPLVVRFLYGDYARKINTYQPEESVRKTVKRVLYDFDLDVEQGEVFGQLRTSMSSFLTVRIEGEVFLHQEKNELMVDLSYRSSVTALAILLGILCWPLLIVGAILLPNQAKEEFHKQMKDISRELERRLKR